MTVSACMIVRDGVEDGLERSLASVRPFVDEVCVWENNSTDGTPELLARVAADSGAPIRVERGVWTDDFAAARNASAAMASSEWCLWLDPNDELIGGENIAALIARADAEDATAVYALWDRYERPSDAWWPTLARRDHGHWEGRVHETWRRDGIDRWRYGVGQPGSIYAHPAALRVHHRDRQPTPFKYLGILSEAVKDPERSPLALVQLADEHAKTGNDRLAVELWETYLEGGWDACEGDPNSYRASVLQSLTLAYGRLGQAGREQEYASAWNLYSSKLTHLLPARHRDFLRALSDADGGPAREWIAVPPDELADVLLDPETSSPYTPRDRNGLCWCGRAAKFKRCHGA